MKTEHKEFKPFDRVLVRANSIWQPDLYSFYEKLWDNGQRISDYADVNLLMWYCDSIADNLRIAAEQLSLIEKYDNFKNVGA